jgi:type IV secretion system protein VirB6
MSACQDLAVEASAGVAPALRAVDCFAGEMTASAFARLFGSGGALLPALTVLLTLYIAFFAISLLTGRSRIGISALTPRMITLGLVLTFATSWAAYSQVLWNIAVAGPDWIASVLTGSQGSASLIFADRIDIVFAAIEQASAAAAEANAAGAQAAPAAAGMFKPADIMWLGALLLLLGTVGVLLTARIALVILMALGPLFVVLALFGGTRGLTTGWLKGLAMTGLVPLFVVLGGAITLELLVPVISALSQGAQFGEISGRAAMALFLVAAVHVALMTMVIKVAATIVAGWKVFGLVSSRGENREEGAPRSTGSNEAVAPSAVRLVRSNAFVPVRHMEPAEGTALAVAGSAAAGASTGRRVTTLVSGGGIEPVQPRLQDRARGIGSRFRAASNDSGRAMTGASGKGAAK